VKISANNPKARRMQQLGVRWHVSFIKKIDDWRAAQEDEPARAEAVRRLVRRGLQARDAEGGMNEI
jgi:hypothetical protein